MGNNSTDKVWRYLKFSRFVWLLQRQQLWLSRADLLGDSWEITLAGDQLAHMIRHAPSRTLPLEEPYESPMQRAERIIPIWRRETFINCWSLSEHESHALWRIYCGNEGVAIQTTFAKLKESVGGIPLLPVTYEVPGNNYQTPTCMGLATKKRPMFAYEHEIRLVDWKNDTAPQPEIPGYGLEWKPDRNIESIRVHPEAGDTFLETVIGIVAHYAPALKDCVARSDMAVPPPF